MRFCFVLVTISGLLLSQTSKQSPADKFRQLEEILPTPNEYRAASGAPGHRYWQQKVDYNIKVEIDDINQRCIGSETITYKNNSPDTLTYLWLQLDQNIFEPGSDSNLTMTAPDMTRLSYTMAQALMRDPFPGGYRIATVKDAAGAPLPFTVVKTMMRVDLKKPLLTGESTTFSVDWSFNIVNARKIRARSGFEYFPDDKNYLYEMAQWFPRLAAYYDVYGWQHKQFLGSGEFTLEFGDYKVAITVPDDHIVASTGVLQNPNQVLTASQRQRLTEAATAKRPVKIVTEAEATANEKNTPKGKKTWIYHADNVRDFGFANSRKFIWDAQGHTVEGKTVLAMSYYPKEGNPLWEQYSTAAIIHTLNVYGKFSFAYPYPIAISVNGPIGGMEYPMICFNGPRPQKDKTYSSRTKYGLISVVIHEVGHNFFPMIVNTDERQWTWLDEGINSFLQYLAESEWEANYPSRRGEPKFIAAYMSSADHDLIMTNSESIINLGANAYTKTATGLNILRETILGRELFDFAFREYSRRWKFKRPTPSDFFRTMEDASGIDLDWFWRGWFYSIDHTDLAIDKVRQFTLDTKNPEIEKPIKRKAEDEEPITLSEQRNKNLPKLIDSNPDLKDFYNSYDQFNVTAKDKDDYQKLLAGLEEEERQALRGGSNFYMIDLKNIGGLVMPVILEIEYSDGQKQEMRIPAEIWRRNNVAVSKLLVTPKEVKSITLDPHLETADTDLSNNTWPAKPVKTQFQLFKEKDEPNPMQLDRNEKKK
ncbi:MAG: M1 family metallopeptidase [Acidobacteria bacterium]|nr:M1 family metallopeptidase [Acidobacteriota bacterium]